MSDNKILIFQADESEKSSVFSVLQKTVDVNELSKEISEFQKKLSQAFSALEKATSGFQVEEITINGEITASGKIGIAGFGVEGSSKGGISFKFVRK